MRFGFLRLPYSLQYFNFIILVNFCWIGVVKTPRMSTCIYQMQCSNP